MRISRTDSSDSGIVARLIRVMDRLADSPAFEGLSATELSRLTGLAVPTVHRLLLQLAQGGLTYQHPHTKRWYLGLRTAAYGQAALQHFPFVRLAQPILYDVVATTRETAVFTLRDGDYGIYAAIVESPEKLRLTETIGMRLPLTVGASRRVILAFLPPNEQSAIIARICANDPSLSVAALKSECQRIAQEGYAVSFGEVTPHTVGVTVPVRSNQNTFGSLMLAGPDTRVTSDKISDLVTKLKHAAQRFETAASPDL
ncbi:transcriptional regulator, IclR family [Sulfobacillus acidophilus TPY]|uniref:Transcriptional regulator, IclR family n=1 Tax=Sulfobacillus acidophilus (strain ATCC 700253 / DSM 10332 / NAL) TaxID=679936 RepID=G8TYF8_SULAD|nr:transcriptional regulator, IclR family [Sulfobacillus acidophilus TPY]AEW06219.1 transcriptional regulator, IclR family [Sulfobacillus acidophilus DSM 10332]